MKNKYIAAVVAASLLTVGIAYAAITPSERELKFIELGRLQEQLEEHHGAAEYHRGQVEDHQQGWVQVNEAKLSLEGELFPQASQ
ncbi:MAG: hypothetical protein DRJ69_06850 [Thermoprotei archaeon]|nr:MAG: hypothetical protein DRJ69_06850 [Thermoprotei archaeon]